MKILIIIFLLLTHQPQEARRPHSRKRNVIKNAVVQKIQKYEINKTEE